tara:strand:- start:3117 stop:4130 length:1014 start_codon:yes stop_codon:yes gene_type:complete
MSDGITVKVGSSNQVTARIGPKNVVRVLSNASAPPTKLLNLNDVNSSLKTRDGMILVWDLLTETFFLTDTIDSSSLNITGIATFSNTTNSSAPTNGALVIDGGIGIGKAVNIGGNVSIVGISTFASDLDINAAVDILNGLTVNSTFNSVGITTLASAGGITTTGGELYVGTNLQVAGTSNFIGNATFRGGTIGIGDSTSDDIDVGGEFVSNLVPNTDNTYDIGITTQRWRDGNFSGLVTTNNLFVSGISTFNGNLDFNSNIDIEGNIVITGFASVTEGLYYDTNDYDGPNGIAYFDNTGKLIGAASTENATTETYYILTTNAVGIPTWTSVIDGGIY